MADESGVAGLVLASVIAIVTLGALSIFLNNFVGGQSLNKLQATLKAQTKIEAAVYAYFNTQTPKSTLPCPDTSVPPDGIADTCATGSPSAGTVPWVTLGLSEEEVVDGYNTFFRYVVSEVGKDMCLSAGDAYDTSAVAYNGDVIDPSDLSLNTAGNITHVPFAIISLGANRRGGIQGNRVTYALTPENTDEIANASSTPSTIYKSPYSAANGTAHFDDEVLAPTRAQTRRVCQQLATQGQSNDYIDDPFDTGSNTLDRETFETSATDAPTEIADPRVRKEGNRVAEFTTVASYFATTTDFNPLRRPLIISTLWTPDPQNAGATSGGFSIATRATRADLTASSDIFGANAATGLTFRFDNRTASNMSSAGVANNISIRDQSGALATSADTYKLINAATYRLEVYDNGAVVWMRITQVDDPTNAATVSLTTSTDINGPENRIFFINGPARSFIDNVRVSLPMLALENGSTTAGVAGNGVAATAASNVNGTTTGDLTLEAWVRPRVLPTGSNRAAIISQWDTNTSASASGQSFRLYLNGSLGGAIAFGVGTTTSSTAAIETYQSRSVPAVDAWTHIAVTFDRVNKDVKLFVNGDLQYSWTSKSDANIGVNAAAHRFAVGASFDSDATITDVFNGDISDVRVWDVERTALQIASNFETRLATTSGLVANWQLGIESGGLGSSTVIASPSGTDGALTGTARYIPSRSLFFRPRNTFCPSSTRVFFYTCEFRNVAQSQIGVMTIPSTLSSVYVSVWGAGGGGYSDGTNIGYGGGGGYSGAALATINGVSISNMQLDVFVGAGGTGSQNTHNGGGGGGASAIRRTFDSSIGLLAGGGGGAAYADLAALDCATRVDTSTQCGLGGGGAGGNAATTRAPSGNGTAALCGGRGGSNMALTGPPVAGVCSGGGDDPSGSTGGSGTVTATGGTSTVGNGGNAFNNPTGIGSGGGGGGAVGGEAGGFADVATDADVSAGFGGGGGSGSSDAGAANVLGAAGSYYSNTTRTGTTTSGDTTITNLSPNIISSGWAVGQRILGSGIPTGAVITAINSSTSIEISQAATASSTSVALTVRGSAAGGNTNPNYSRFGISVQGPGAGGSTDTTVDGRPGAVVFTW